MMKDDTSNSPPDASRTPDVRPELPGSEPQSGPGGMVIPDPEPGESIDTQGLSEALGASESVFNEPVAPARDVSGSEEPEPPRPDESPERNETRGREVLSAVAGLRQLVEATAQTQADLIAHVYHDLIGERRATALQKVLGAIAPRLDRLRAMRESLSEKEHMVARDQLTVIIELLARILFELGFQPFSPAIGSEFDPHQMECDGFIEGEAGTVRQVARPGYLAGNRVDRVAGVIIGREADGTAKD